MKTKKYWQEEANEMVGKYDWEVIASYMDDEIREKLHFDLAPCSNEEFLQEYLKKHYKKYNSEFSIN